MTLPSFVFCIFCAPASPSSTDILQSKLWMLFFIISRLGEGQISSHMPDSLTTWQFQAVAIHPDKGICVAEPYKAKTFKKLFVNVNMPRVAVKGEHITVRATFFNYYSEQRVRYLFLYLGTKHQIQLFTCALHALVVPRSSKSQHYFWLPCSSEWRVLFLSSLFSVFL